MLVWRFVELRGLEPTRFQCLREVLAISVGGAFSPNTLLFTQLAGEHVSMPRTASRSKMVHLDFCKENGIPINRSFTHAKEPLFIDSNTIRTMTVVNKDTFNIGTAKHLFYEAAVASFRNLGLVVKHIPKTNNLLIKGKKLSACSVHTHGNSILFPWSVALDFNHNRAEKVIISPKNMREWITTVKKELGREVSVEELRSAVKQGFQQALGITLEEGELSSEELSKIEGLLPKYTSETWLKYGKWSPVKDYWRPE